MGLNKEVVVELKFLLSLANSPFHFKIDVPHPVALKMNFLQNCDICLVFVCLNVFIFNQGMIVYFSR